MAIATYSSIPKSFVDDVDNLLSEVCEQLQLAPYRYDLAVDRYNALNKVLESGDSPFRSLGPNIYPQGSMKLGTTVKPLGGEPHDLDLVLQLSLDHDHVDPMRLIQKLYGFLEQHGTYGPMTSLKNRCVRIEYADDFYLDLLPACRNSVRGGTCIKVPDRALQGWTDSNPLGYAKWFKEKSVLTFVRTVLDSAAPVPPQQAVSEKSRLQLVVQLSKRWRDLYYSDMDPDLTPISIVLTTLAADFYRGELSVSEALMSVLNGIVGAIEASRRAYEKHLRVLNPSNTAEDLSERWDSNPSAYDAFVDGVRDFHKRWSELMRRRGNVNAELKSLFGEPVTTVLKKRAMEVKSLNRDGKLGVTSSGAIALTANAAVRARPNTFYGKE